MILNAKELFSSAQAITADAASTNIFDTGAPGTVYAAAAALTRDLGKGNSVPIAISVTTAFATCTSITIAYQVATDAAFTTPVELCQSTFTLAQLNSNLTHFLPDRVPAGANLRYHRLYYTVNGSDATAGAITAGYAMAVQTNTIL